jgi:hypothetical protein
MHLLIKFLIILNKIIELIFIILYLNIEFNHITLFVYRQK